MARARVRTGCPAEGKATPGRQDTAAHRSPHGRLDRASPRWGKNLFLASRLLSPSPVKRERGWGEGVSGHVEVVEGSSEVKSRTLTRRCAPPSHAGGRGAGTPPSFGSASRPNEAPQTNASATGTMRRLTAYPDWNTASLGTSGIILE